MIVIFNNHFTTNWLMCLLVEEFWKLPVVKIWQLLPWILWFSFVGETVQYGCEGFSCFTVMLMLHIVDAAG